MTDDIATIRLKARLYAALKHEKSCACGECSGGLNAVDDLAFLAEQARAEANRLREALRKIASYRGLDPLVASNIAHNALAGPQTKEQTT